jgi:UDP-2,3-diacylglucosamine pyrophosphatase LpxH
VSAFLDRPTIVERMPDDQAVWFVSDLHLGDGTPCDVFFGKDRHLIALAERVEREGAVLVIVGDAIDFHQAWSFIRVLRAHQELFATLTRLGRDGRLYYIVGNHDYDLSLFHELLHFRVCDELHIGKRIRVVHGYQYDPYLSKSVGRGHHWSTTIHHLFERWLGTWLRIPLGEFYTVSNRLMFWLMHKLAVGAATFNLVGHRLGLPGGQGVLDYLDYWIRGNMGDPMGMFRPAWEHLAEGDWQYIVCGHSHLPGVVPRGDRAYVNTGSWTFASSHYVFWDGNEFIAKDWITGRDFTTQFYDPLLEGTVYQTGFFQWWRANYMGLFRYREGEERVGRFRGWESYIRDYQYLSQPGLIDSQPAAPPPDHDDEPSESDASTP